MRRGVGTSSPNCSARINSWDSSGANSSVGLTTGSSFFMRVIGISKMRRVGTTTPSSCSLDTGRTFSDTLRRSLLRLRSASLLVVFIVVRLRSPSRLIDVRGGGVLPPDWKTLSLLKGLSSFSAWRATAGVTAVLGLPLLLVGRFASGSLSCTSAKLRWCFTETLRGVSSGGAVLCLVRRGVGTTSCGSSVRALVDRRVLLVLCGAGVVTSSSSFPATELWLEGTSSIPLLVRLTRAFADRMLRACDKTCSLTKSTNWLFLAEDG